MSIGRQAAQGAFWNYAAFLSSKGVLFLATLVLAKVLTQAEFGLVGMALLVITALDILREFGIGAAVIYRQRDGQAAANLAFAISLSLGTALFLANWVLAPTLVLFFKTSGPQETETLTAVLRVLAFSILFTSAGSTQDALLQKDLNYRRRMIPEVARTVIKGGLSVGLALTGAGVWSLVLGQVLGDAGAMVLLWIVSPWRPTREFRRDLVRPMLRYGLQIMLVDALGTLVNDVDYLIIGRLLGPAPLGVYTLAFKIPELLIKNLSQAVSTVAFPVAARLQGDLATMRQTYLTMQRYMLIILAPLGFGLAAVTPTLLHIVYGHKWDAAIPVMQILTVYMVLGGISHWPGVVYKAVGRPDILNRLSFLKLVLLVPTLWWGAANYGIEGVAWGQLVIRVAGILIDMAAVSRFVHVGVGTNLRVLWAPLAAGGLMAGAVAAVFLLDPAQTSLPILALAIVVGAAVYAALIWLLDRSSVLALLDLARSLIRRTRPTPAPADAGLGG